MKLFVVSFVLASYLAANADAYSRAMSMRHEWESFKMVHKKTYNGPDEEKFRFKVYLATKAMVEEHNKMYAAGLVSFDMAVNKYADIPHEEFIKRNTLHAENGDENMFGTLHVRSNKTAADAVDWRAKGAVTAVKDQGQCGSCWAFSATGSIEGQVFVDTGKLVSISEQNLIDCSAENSGCNGGLAPRALAFVKKNGGIDTESAYPYEGQSDNCKYDPSSSADTVSDVKRIPKGDEKSLQDAIAHNGPISVSLDASHSSFQHYKTGIYKEPHCSNTRLDHAVLAVGYGTDKKGRDYYIVKNSWGTDWGDEGYIKIPRNKHNYCGIATRGSYPTGTK